MRARPIAADDVDKSSALESLAWSGVSSCRCVSFEVLG